MAKNPENYPKISDAELAYFSGENTADQFNKAPRTTRGKQIAAFVVGSLLAGGVVWVAGGVVYGVNLLPRVSVSADLKDAGKAAVKEINTRIDTYPMATASTEASGVKIAIGLKAENVPLFDTLQFDAATKTRGAGDVRTNLDLNLNEVQLSFDKNKTEHQMTITASEASMKTSIDIMNLSGRTEAESGSLATLPFDLNTAVTKSIAGTFGGDASDVPIFGAFAEGTMTFDDMTDDIADLQLLTQVDKYCTPLILKLPDFMTQVQENVRDAVSGQILKSSKTNDPSNPGLADMLELSVSEAQKVVEDAEVILPDTVNIASDQSKKDMLQKYVESGFIHMSNNEKKMDCGIDKNAKLITRADADAESAKIKAAADLKAVEDAKKES
jgi:hypothetical protein